MAFHKFNPSSISCTIKRKGREGLVTEAGEDKLLISSPTLRVTHSSITWPCGPDHVAPWASLATVLCPLPGPASISPLGWEAVRKSLGQSPLTGTSVKAALSQFMGAPLIHGVLCKLQSLDPNFIPGARPPCREPQAPVIGMKVLGQSSHPNSRTTT